MENLTAELLGSLAGVLLSLVFAYVPGLKQKFEALSGEFKRVVLFASLVVVSLGIFALSCAGIVAGVTCDKSGAVALVRVFVSALIASQAAYVLEK